MKYPKLFLFLKYLLFLYIGLNILIYGFLFIRETNHRGYKMNTLSERNSYAIGGVIMINYFLPFMIVGSIKSIF
jgi:hypothetical protein